MSFYIDPTQFFETAHDIELFEFVRSFFDDPMGYVMAMWDWEHDELIRHVPLAEPWRSRYDLEFGPDKWACEFLDQWGEQIKEREYNGKKAVMPIQFSTVSGHGIGKSCLSAWITKFIMDTRPLSRMTVSSGKSEQLRTRTWAELNKWHRKSMTEHWFDITSGRGSMSLRFKQPRWREEWFATGQTCSEENADNFAGQHALGGTSAYLFDEAGGVPDPIWVVRLGGLTDGEPMTFDFGNPTKNTGYFHKNCVGEYKDDYIVRQIDSRQAYLTNKPLFEKWKKTYGEESAIFRIRVKGEFTDTASAQFIPTEIVETAERRELPQGNGIGPLVIGVDVARFGDDDTVIYPRIGDDARTWAYERYNGLDNVQVADRVRNMVQRFASLGVRCYGIFIDGGSLGSGPVDILRHGGYPIYDVNFGRNATDREHYRYKGDEMWGAVRDALETRLCIPQDADLKRQLITREYGFIKDTTVMTLMPKEEHKILHDESPDIVDGLALTYYAQPAVLIAPGSAAQKPRKVESDWNPYARARRDGPRTVEG